MKIITTRGRYHRGEAVGLRFFSETEIAEEVKLRIGVYHLDILLFETMRSAAETEISLNLSDKVIPEGAGAFGVVCELTAGGDSLGKCSTAFDFYGENESFIRYGFLSDFTSADAGGAEEALDFLAEFHMSHVQFYDWTYRHHAYEGPADVFTDTMGKEIDFRLVKRKITGCKKRGMKAVGYGAVYAAGEEYLDEYPEQSLQDADGKPYNLIDRFFIMDICRGSQWRETLMRQYEYAYREAGFNGIHMDTYGFPKRAFAYDDGCRKLVHLEDDFPNLINETRRTLGEEAVLIFNNVGNWPVDATGPANQDAVYIEVWEPHDEYHHIRQIILSAALHLKPVIIAAYLAPFRLEKNHGGCRALNSALILHSAITSFGASHLLLGEGGTVLTQGYYNDYSKLRTDERNILRLYYDFQLRYADLFYNPELVEISETHTAGENREFFFTGAPVSADGRAGTVWTIVRESRNLKIISLLNLTAQQDSFWNAGKHDYFPVERFSIEMPDDGSISRGFTASPDRNQGCACTAEVKKVRNARGAALQLELEDLGVWTIVVLERENT